MLSIFLFEQRKFFQIAIWLLIWVGIGEATSEITRKTLTTKCQITFQALQGDSSGSQLKFKGCKREKCLRNLVNGVCKFQEFFQLAQEKCYKQCCGETFFDQAKCQIYNEIKAVKQEERDNIILIGLGLSFAILLITILVFIKMYMKCDEKERIIDNESNLEYEGFEWKKGKLNKKKLCGYCERNQAEVRLNCGEYYHLKCLKELENWKCSKCEKQINKMRIFCRICGQKYVKLMSTDGIKLETKFFECLSYHEKYCYEELRLDVGTQVKFTESTKE